MTYFILQNRRLPKQTVSYFKFQDQTANTSPFLSIKIRGKEEIIPFKDNKEMVSIKERLIETFSDFVKVGNSYIKRLCSGNTNLFPVPMKMYITSCSKLLLAA